MGGGASDRRRSAGPGLRSVAAYAAMLAGAATLYLLVRGHGASLAAPAASEAAAQSVGRPPDHVLMHVLLALVVVIAASRALSVVFRNFRQPPVIGEVVAGIVLGPSVLGRVAPDAMAFLVPNGIASHLGIISQVGVILFLFLVGLELDPAGLKERPHTTLAISHASIIVPFLLGSTLALWLYPILSNDRVSFTNFSLFLGIAMSVTAFPVLARILTDRGEQRTKLGALALSCAAVDDATAWCLLAFVIGVARAQIGDGFLTGGLTVGYVLLMLVVVRPVVKRFVRKQELLGRLSQGAVASVFIGLLLSALVTEVVGIHAVFGAFLLGAIIAPESLLARELKRKLEDLVVVLLLPAFFAVTGLRTQIGLLNSSTDWLVAAAVLCVACVGKVGGTTLAARLTGLSLRESAALGILMNTRGLMELIILNVGLDMGMISPRLFAMMVLMAVFTTLMTTPLLQLLNRSRTRDEAAGDVAVGRL